MSRVEDAFPAACALLVCCDLAAGVEDADPAGGELDLHALADQPPWHTIGIAIDFDAAVRLDPARQLADLPKRRSTAERPQCHFELGRVLSEKLGREPEASRAYEAALSDRPDHHAALDALADISYRQQDWERAGELYLLLEGEVDIVKDHGTSHARILREYTPVDYFGEMAILDSARRSATAVARTHARLLTLDGPSLKSLIQQMPEISFAIFPTLTARVRAAEARLSELDSQRRAR